MAVDVRSYKWLSLAVDRSLLGSRTPHAGLVSLLASSLYIPTSTMSFWLRLLSFALLKVICGALFEEDVGVLDFTLSSTGHGPVTRALPVGAAVVTSDASFELGTSSSCYVAARNAHSGVILWRRFVCTFPVDDKHAFAVGAGHVFTLDSAGAFKAWDARSGELVWERAVAECSVVWSFSFDGVEYVAAGGQGDTRRVFVSTSGADGDSAAAKRAAHFRPGRPERKEEVKCDKLAKASIRIDATGKTLEWLTSTTQGKISLLKEGILVSDNDSIHAFELLMCTKNFSSVLLASERGTTCQLTLAVESDELRLTTGWIHQDGISSVSAALFLDSSHFVADLEAGHESLLLGYRSRLESQARRLLDLFALKAVDSSLSRDHFFGFVKTVVLLSTGNNRLYGVDTSGKRRAEVRYTLDLPESAWHRLVHGGHNRDVLVLSQSSVAFHWVCFDGASGLVHKQGSVETGASAVQIIPMPGTSSCRQSALVILDDKSILIVPDDEATVKLVEQNVRSPAHGFFTHVLHRAEGRLESLSLLAHIPLELSVIGSLAFPGEEVLRIAYPAREDVVHSPCVVLGDDSLLLKYVNPHIMVIITMSKDMDRSSFFSGAIKTVRKGPQKRKPTGVGGSGVELPSTAEENGANLFVNVVDSVSSRLLYRAAHANAGFYPSPTAVISENWIVYTFFDVKAGRSVIGVLSLYEGMIDSKGLTAFSTPEHSSTLSSLDARESKPVVLAKSYTMATAISAAGMTASRNGISNRKLVLAGVDGQVFSIERKLLEPRRPVGELKDAEKKEGLVQYSELLPSIPYLSLSSSQSIESVKHIISSSTDLESQSLILAFGGPDIFFCRTSPSRGFDLLPDSFNRELLSIVIIALGLVVIFSRGRVSRRSLKDGWY